MSSIKTSPFGGNGGGEFEMTSPIKEIGLRTGDRVDQIRINGKSNGGGGGSDRGSITLNLAHDEYINQVDIRSGQEVDMVKFTTNLGNSIGGGGKGGSATTLSNIRLLAIGGRAGKRVDKLNIKYVSDYKASNIIATNVGFIIAYSCPNQTFTQYTESTTKVVDSYEKITTHMNEKTYSASVEAEYYVKVSASTGIDITDTTQTTIIKELETSKTTSLSTTITLDEKHVGVSLVTGTLMQDGDDSSKYWMYPTGDEMSYSVIALTDIDNLLGFYDLTGTLYTQMPGLINHKEEQYGFVHYNK